ncbi:MAG TPA: helix-turn-helix transcriptional regulator [Candidatus Ornithomonoglobus merdipullorum]|uniref:Helix-turn-helix transcriptional regulator n=1 Tax=Candidatus Ornithomonoglobus merdipullorum TaxID=2840895 RepID=A0A9D1MCH8_9FIRM|nr:helix-turn-helix transcriptional regulator [Candidatus Ornithomonoglobus merdipullorum]
MTVTETAICCAFFDSNYFPRLFKRTYDKTPCEYRNSFFMN